MSRNSLSTIVSGLALFSMFFGAGNVVFPLILGSESGDQNIYAVTGLALTAVLFPLLGLMAMMLFNGDYDRFFGRVGRRAGPILLFLVQFILGPIGSIPRLITLSYASVKPFLPGLPLSAFSIMACGLLFITAYRPQRVIALLGYVLTPLLLGSLGLIIGLGMWSHPEPHAVTTSPATSFIAGLHTGYNTLDLIASFLFASLVIGHFKRQTADLAPKKARRETIRRFIKASCIAALLLGLSYAGLSFVASYYVPQLSPGLNPEDLLGAIAHAVLGPWGGIIASIAVALACLTTAISLTTIASEYIQRDLLKGKASLALSIGITLAISGAIANLGFTGIAKMLGPILQIAYPGLIVLSLLNIAHKLYRFRPVKIPVATTFALAAMGYFL